MSKGIWVWVRDIAIAVVIAIVIMQFFRPTIVNGDSMQNTLQDSDYLFLSKQAYTIGGEPERGDIVVVHSSLMKEKGEGEGTKDLIKRVIAVAGDTVAIHDGTVYVNGEALVEPYTKDGYTNGQLPEMTVPDGKLFLLGDNREHSHDSRSEEVGFVAERDLVGKAVFRVFPFSEFGPIN